MTEDVERVAKRRLVPGKLRTLSNLWPDRIGQGTLGEMTDDLHVKISRAEAARHLIRHGIRSERDRLTTRSAKARGER